jgi:hypothetical protein
MNPEYLNLARRVAGLFAELPQVEAVALSGSLGGNLVDVTSDIDLYVYTQADIPLDVRETIVELSGGATRADVGLNFWGPGDEWFEAASGIEVDIIYFDARWVDDQVRRVMQAHQPSLGYSTCFAFTVNHSQVFFDPQDWFAGLQAISRQPYPEPLRENIIRHNHPVLRKIIPSYFFQLEKAVKRGDLVSVNHRLAGLLASYFDILFALNRQLHPGEKRMVQRTMANCMQLPANMETEIATVLKASALAEAEFLEQVNALLDHLDALLWKEGFGELLGLA